MWGRSGKILPEQELDEDLKAEVGFASSGGFVYTFSPSYRGEEKVGEKLKDKEAPGRLFSIPGFYFASAR